MNKFYFDGIADSYLTFLRLILFIYKMNILIIKIRLILKKKSELLENNNLMLKR
jgi:hypothetical protein